MFSIKSMHLRNKFSFMSSQQKFIISLSTNICSVRLLVALSIPIYVLLTCSQLNLCTAFLGNAVLEISSVLGLYQQKFITSLGHRAHTSAVCSKISLNLEVLQIFFFNFSFQTLNFKEIQTEKLKKISGTFKGQLIVELSIYTQCRCVGSSNLQIPKEPLNTAK